MKANGRWHYAGQPIVYLAENPAAALLEVCVHTCANDVPPDFTLLQIEGPDIAVPTLAITDLPLDWPTNFEATRELGTNWLRTNTAVLLQVPSAVVPRTVNLLFNPMHSQAGLFRIVDAISYPFDMRIKQ